MGNILYTFCNSIPFKSNETFKNNSIEKKKQALTAGKAYFPEKFGFLFSKKALVPSLKS